MSTEAKFIAGADLLRSWHAELESGTPPVRYTLSEPFAALDLRPGRVIGVGGAPGSGKTTALLQVGIELLRMNAGARLLIANVEMVPTLLVDRIVSRIAAVPVQSIMDRTLTADDAERVSIALKTLDGIAGRLAFLVPPYSLENVTAAAGAFSANVLILDYIQRFKVGDNKLPERERLEQAAYVLRRIADAGALVIVAAAVARQKSATGSTYKGVNLASFRGSSEFEYGFDAAYNAIPGDGGLVTLQCEKNRFGEVADIVTAFDANVMTFTTAPKGLDAFEAAPSAPSPKGRKKAKGVIACDA